MSPRFKAFSMLSKGYQRLWAYDSIHMANKTIQLRKTFGKAISITSARFKASIKKRREAGRTLVSLMKKKPQPIDRVVNARGKGIVFRRIGGRIVPIRVKK